MSLYYSDANKNLHKVAGNINLPTNVERVDVVYDKDSSDASINLGYTGGVQNLQEVNIDLSKYKKCNAYLNLYESGNFASGSGNRNDILQIDLLTNRIENNLSVATNTFGYIYYFDETWNVNSSQLFMARIDYNHLTKTFVPKLAYDGQLVTSSNYYIYKIEGIY